MGKEIIDARMFVFNRRTPPSVVPQKATYQYLANAWCNKENAVSKEDVKEDGCIIATVQSAIRSVTVMCRGLRAKGNQCLELIEDLRNCSLIKLNERIEEMLVYKDFTWHQVDVFNETFNSDDQIVVRIAKNERRKRIRIRESKKVLGVHKRLKKYHKH